MEFQTRNEKGSVNLFSSFQEAYAEYLKDPTVFKISFTYNNNYNRWVCKRYYEIAGEDEEKKMKSMSEKYRSAFANRDDSKLRISFIRPSNWSTHKNVFWVNMPLIAPNYIEIIDDNTLTEEEKELKADLDRILEILPQEEFVERFRDLK